jgi:hypothetical protein
MHGHADHLVLGRAFRLSSISRDQTNPHGEKFVPSRRRSASVATHDPVQPPFGPSPGVGWRAASVFPKNLLDRRALLDQACRLHDLHRSLFFGLAFPP